MAASVSQNKPIHPSPKLGSLRYCVPRLSSDSRRIVKEREEACNGSLLFMLLPNCSGTRISRCLREILTPLVASAHYSTFVPIGFYTSSFDFRHALLLDYIHLATSKVLSTSCLSFAPLSYTLGDIPRIAEFTRSTLFPSLNPSSYFISVCVNCSPRIRHI